MRQFLLVIWISSLEAQVFTSSPGAPAHYVGWNRPVYDPVSRRVVTWWNDWSGAGTIYVNSAFSFRTSDKTFIKVGTSSSGQGNATASGTTITRTSGKTFEQSWVGSKIAISAAHYTIQSVASGNTLTVASGSPSSGAWDMSCPTSTSSWFGDRHTYQKTTIDTRRKRLYQVGGACSSGAGQDHKNDTWYIALNENPASATFNRVTTATNSPPSPLGGIAEYSPASDVIIWVGYDGGSGADPYYIFAPTDKGALLSAQTTAGASSADNWNALSGLKGNGGVNCVGGGDACPRPGITITRTGKMVNRTADNKLYWFTTSNDSTVNQIWTYDPPNKRWQKITDTNTPGWNTSIASNTPVLDYDRVNDLFWYYLPNNKHLYTFNPGTNSWSDRGLFSSLPSTSELGVYDAAQHAFIVIDGDESGAAGTFWIGKLPHSLSVNLTIQEALYPGDFTGKTLSAAGGIARTDEPFCMGVPLKDIWNVTDTQTLGLTGRERRPVSCPRVLAFRIDQVGRGVRHRAVATGGFDCHRYAHRRRIRKFRRLQSCDGRHAYRGFDKRRHLRFRKRRLLRREKGEPQWDRPRTHRWNHGRFGRDVDRLRLARSRSRCKHDSRQGDVLS
jgi:hypothetical protein